MEENQNNNDLIEQELAEELSFSDKLTGVFSEPANTFAELAKFPPRALDWFLPFLISMVFIVISNFLMMSNPMIKQQMMEKQMEKTQEMFQEYVEKGQMTQEQVDQQLDMMMDNADASMGTQMMFMSIGTLVGGFIIFFLIVTFYFMIAKFILKGDGSWSGTLVAVGLPSYISALNIIVMLVIAMITETHLTNLSLANLITAESGSILEVILKKLDIFTIWYYLVLSIGLAKMFKSDNTQKYIITIFAIWIGFSLLMAVLANAVPFLKFFNM